MSDKERTPALILKLGESGVDIEPLGDTKAPEVFALVNLAFIQNLAGRFSGIEQAILAQNRTMRELLGAMMGSANKEPTQEPVEPTRPSADPTPSN